MEYIFIRAKKDVIKKNGEMKNSKHKRKAIAKKWRYGEVQ